MTSHGAPAGVFLVVVNVSIPTLDGSDFKIPILRESTTSTQDQQSLRNNEIQQHKAGTKLAAKNETSRMQCSMQLKAAWRCKTTALHACFDRPPERKLCVVLSVCLLGSAAVQSPVEAVTRRYSYRFLRTNATSLGVMRGGLRRRRDVMRGVWRWRSCV